MGSGRKSGLLLAKARALDRDSLPSLVIAAHGADVVRAAHGPALRAARQTGQLESQVTPALALSRLWITFLWQWGHWLVLPFAVAVR